MKTFLSAAMDMSSAIDSFCLLSPQYGKTFSHESYLFSWSQKSSVFRWLQKS